MRYSGSVSEKARVAVLAGGWTSRRDMSLEAGQEAAASLRAAGYEVMNLDPPKDLVRFAAQLITARPDVVLNLLPQDAKGIEGALQLSNLPYVTADAQKKLDFPEQIKAIIGSKAS